MSGKCPRKFRRGPILKDNKSGEDVGYIQPQVEFNIDTLMKGINELKKGILLFPYSKHHLLSSTLLKKKKVKQFHFSTMPLKIKKKGQFQHLSRNFLSV